jgi:murein L,D-transpeptidase YcbB/YkuD
MSGVIASVVLFGGEAPTARGESMWVDAAGRPTRDAYEALTLLQNATVEGLDPAEYQSVVLDSLSAALAHVDSRDDAARFEAMLTSSTLRYLRDLHSGRVDPRVAGFRMTLPPDHHDFAALLRSAVAEHRLPATAAELAPPFALYRALRDALARYRSLASDRTLDGFALSATTLRPGDTASELSLLRRRLVALGDLAAGPVSAEAAVYDAPLVAAVKRFQRRHGIEPDGVVGRQTEAALGVPLAARVRQLELALERLRWLPHPSDEPLIAVNIPMFHLWAWDSHPAEAPSLDMDVIVGRAVNTQTPVFVEEMRSVVFRPYWNVPSSIVRHEILPRIESDLAYLDRQNMEIVAGPGDDARIVAATVENVERLKQGALRIRQRPGPNNSLGLVKFVFPNDENVYMHGTPAMQLFSRSRRDFSHGCVRLEDPIGLAEWVLNDHPEWTRERIVAATLGEQPVRVDLRRPIQVILFYVTAAVMPDDGTVRFAEDIYGHDVKLERALARRSTAS